MGTDVKDLLCYDNALGIHLHREKPVIEQRMRQHLRFYWSAIASIQGDRCHANEARAALTPI